MTWIKICGITNLEDARIAVDAGADALGFVFWEKSPRRVDPESARKIVEQLPKNIEKVGVFVNDTFESMEQQATNVGLTAIQAHGEHHRDNGAGHKPSTIKRYAAVPANRFLDEQGRFQGGFLNLGVGSAQPDAIFLDSGTQQQPGGTGKTFDWEKALVRLLGQVTGINVVIAGGLTPENVREAIRLLHPWGVDVASGVEARPGKKDPDKVRAFVKAVREADKSA